MKTNFAVRTLNRIQSIYFHMRKLRDMGIDLSESEFDRAVNYLEECVAIMFTHTEKQFEEALGLVQWWLYDKVEKQITLPDKTKLDVSKPENFIAFLEKEYTPHSREY